MIKSAEELKGRKVEIDLTGPDGNAYVLLGHAVNFMKQLDYDCSHVKEYFTFHEVFCIMTIL